MDRHLRRMRLQYRRRRSVLEAALRRWLPEASILGVAAGVYLTALLPDGADEPAVIRRAAERGVGLEGLATHRATGDGRPGLVLGFAGQGESGLEEAVRAIAL
jgi:GntR family transcriptional regulator / MocR family aminotransferase